MKFRDDIDPANTWIVSDTHFGHDNIVGFCHRPLDHDQLMIAEWRKEVPEDATLIHLGDLCYRGNAYFRHIVAPELTGKNKKIVMGNHDKQRPSFYKQCGFQVCRPFAIVVSRRGGTTMSGPEFLEVGHPAEFDSTYDTVVSFSHYPWSEKDDDRPMFHYDLRLHGHIHNNGYTRDAHVPFLKNHINLSVEQTKYKPVNLKLLLDAVLLGQYPETTQEQLDDARARKEANLAV